jgi:iron(III) transport system permease protein
MAVALAFAGPFAFLVRENLDSAGAVGGLLWSRSTAEPLARTLVLGVSVSLATAVVGTGLAWLVVRTDLPVRRLWAVAAPLPLVIPSFVGAAALLAAVAPGGMIDELVPGSDSYLPDVEGFWGAWAVLVLFTYPYVYLPVAARLSALPPSLEESGRLLGRGPWAVFRTVVLPQASTAIWAGALLVFLYTVSDYGAVAALDYGTLTVEIFGASLFNQPRAAALGLLLAVVALAVVVAERAVSRRRPVVEGVRSRRPTQLRLGRWRWPALGAVVVLLMNALLGPVSVLGFWSWRGLTGVGEASAAADLADATVNTAYIGVLSAVVTVVLVLPVAYLTARHRTRLGAAANALVIGGFALPGLVVALSLVFWVLQAPVVAGLYQTLPVLLAAYAVHFGAQGMRSAQVALGSVPRRLDDAARMLGAGRRRRFLTIELPLMLPGLLAGAGLVLLSTMKELPATLLLHPIGTDTLAVRIWNARESARWADTGLASLVLVALSAVLVWALIARRVERFD